MSSDDLIKSPVVKIPGERCTIRRGALSTVSKHYGEGVRELSAWAEADSPGIHEVASGRRCSIGQFLLNGHSDAYVKNGQAKGD